MTPYKPASRKYLSLSGYLLYKSNTCLIFEKKIYFEMHLRKHVFCNRKLSLPMDKYLNLVKNSYRFSLYKEQVAENPTIYL